jgi:hypothetical protein
MEMSFHERSIIFYFFFCCFHSFFFYDLRRVTLYRKFSVLFLFVRAVWYLSFAIKNGMTHKQCKANSVWRVVRVWYYCCNFEPHQVGIPEIETPISPFPKFLCSLSPATLCMSRLVFFFKTRVIMLYKLLLLQYNKCDVALRIIIFTRIKCIPQFSEL